jgi:hypothetical protein
MPLETPPALSTAMSGSTHSTWVLAEVGGVQRHVGVLLDQQHRGAALAVDAHDDLEDLLREPRRQAERGLVEQDQLGRGHDGAGDLVAVAAGIGAHQKIVAYRQQREHLTALGYVRQAALNDGRGVAGGDRLTLEVDRPAARVDDPADGLEDGRLAGTIGAEHGGDLAAGNLEADPSDRADRAVVLSTLASLRIGAAVLMSASSRRARHGAETTCPRPRRGRPR